MTPYYWIYGTMEPYPRGDWDWSLILETTDPVEASNEMHGTGGRFWFWRRLFENGVMIVDRM